MSDRPCSEHEKRVRAAVRAAQLDAEEEARLRTDVARSCTPGRYCPPREARDAAFGADA
jgi:hypothetical protein